ncbi:MAG: outer membrane beta-barrel protein [Gemmatimonadaceae bacterium]
MTAAVLLGLLCSASGAAAQSASPSGVVKTKGLMLGAHASGTSLWFQDEDSQQGVGGGVMAGWGFTKWLMVYGGIDGAKIDFKGPGDFDDEFEALGLKSSYTMIHADVGARFSLEQGSMVVPYANVAITGRVLTTEVLKQDVSVHGEGVTLGGGVQFFFNPKFALDLGVQFTAGEFDRYDVDDHSGPLKDFTEVKNSTSARLSVGLKFYPHFSSK